MGICSVMKHSVGTRLVSRKNSINAKSDLKEVCTHLMLMDKHIHDLDGLVEKNEFVSFVYINNNKICSLEPISLIPSVTHLYAQQNLIQSICGLYNLQCLEKINLSFNQISSLRGLEGCTNLRELYIREQNIALPLELPEETMYALSKNLLLMDISGNRISDISPLKYLFALRSLIASDNNITRVDGVLEMLSSCRYLSNMDLTGNSIATERNAIDSIIRESARLTTLNNKEINPNQRQYLMTLKSRQNERQAKAIETRKISLPPIKNTNQGSTQTTFHSSHGKFHVKSKLTSKILDVDKAQEHFSPFLQAISKFN
eukprot:GDKK01066942.1.p1 GENE.GDKK01066942.1~~GDKK01066942.1.p1  ORF type:complete len:316 (-),score=31.06 GDKK01066942.1:41-988(-)